MGFEPTTLRHLVEESHGFKSHLGLGFLAKALSSDHLERIIAVRMPLNRPIIPWVRVSIGLVQFTEQIFKPKVDAFTTWVKRTVDQAVTQAVTVCPNHLHFRLTSRDQTSTFLLWNARVCYIVEGHLVLQT